MAYHGNRINYAELLTGCPPVCCVRTAAGWPTVREQTGSAGIRGRQYMDLDRVLSGRAGRCTRKRNYAWRMGCTSGDKLGSQ